MVISIQPITQEKTPILARIQTAQSQVDSSRSTPSLRASMRRMRFETATPSYTPTSYTPNTFDFEKMAEALQELQEKAALAIQEGRYTEAWVYLDKMENLWKGTFETNLIDFLKEIVPLSDSVDLHPLFQHLINDGVFPIFNSYVLALKGDSQGIALCDKGYENMQRGLQDILELGQRLGMTDITREAQEAETVLKSAYKFFRGLENIAIGSKEVAIVDLREAFALVDQLTYQKIQPMDSETLFFAKVMEQRLNTSLLPEIEIDEKNPTDLFRAGRYQEALNLLPQSDTYETQSLQAYCLAMMGQHDEALDLLNSVWGSKAAQALVFLLKGDDEQAKALAFSHDNPIGYLLLLIAK